MRVKLDGGVPSLSSSGSLVTLRCDRCDITSVEKREDVGAPLGAPA